MCLGGRPEDGLLLLKLFLWDKTRQDQAMLLEVIRIVVMLGIRRGRKHTGQGVSGCWKILFLDWVQVIQTG